MIVKDGGQFSRRDGAAGGEAPDAVSRAGHPHVGGAGAPAAAEDDPQAARGEGPQRAEMTLEIDGERKSTTATGKGPVDATFKAIESVAKSGAELLLYSVNAVTQGTESQGEETVRLAKGGRVVNGIGADTDVIVASAKAYVSALNRLSSKMEGLNPQHQL